MGYHEAFWLAAAAAIPVIALTHVVAFGRAFDLSNAAEADERSGAPTLMFTLAFASFVSCVSVFVLSLQALSVEHDRIALGWPIGLSAFAISTLLINATIEQAVVADRRDAASKSAAPTLHR